jgi:hypothetical protein
MTRTTCAALLIATACATTDQGAAARRDADPGALPPPVAYGGEVIRLGEGTTSLHRPHTGDEGCLAEALGRASGAAGMQNKVRFAVLRDGSLASFSYEGPVTEPQRRAVEQAFGNCRWDPALGPDGSPLAVWVIQPIKVRGAEGPGAP